MSAGQLRRSIGFYGLLFVSLGSIIGSGWLLGALNAAQAAGPASVVSWILAAAMLAVLALAYAELGAAYPVAGGSARFSYYSHGPLTGFTAGWASWLQAVFIAPIEVLAVITYVNSVDAVHVHFNMLDAGALNSNGRYVAIVLMAVFTAINLGGSKLMSESNGLVVVWKAVLPIFAAIVIAKLHFEPANFHAGGGFAPYGMHGVFAALATGVVFALQGFEQAVQLAGEAKNPQRDLARAVILALALGAVLYAFLQFVLIGAVAPGNVAHGWDHPLGATAVNDYGAWYTLALALGAGWLASLLLITAVVSPGGTGIVYLGTTARLSYALGQQRELPSALAKTNAKGTPVVSILVASVIGCLAFGPFKSWKDLVEVVSAATVIMYGFAPISLAALQRLDPDRPRSYRMPWPRVLLPAGFCSANLLMYWTGFDKVWKLAIAIWFGQIIFAIGAHRARAAEARAAVGARDRQHPTPAIANRRLYTTAAWTLPWLGGHIAIGWLGRYGGGREQLPEWIDIGVVIAFSLAIYYLALTMTSTRDEVATAVGRDAFQIEHAVAPDPAP